MKSTEIRLFVLGDIFPGGDLIPNWKEADFDPFHGIRDLLQADELVFGNIECVFYHGPSRPHRGSHLWAPPESVNGLKKLGLSVAGLANNHVMDFGPEAMLRSAALLESNGIRCVGAGRDIRAAVRGCVIEHKGWRVGFAAFTTNAYYVRAITANARSAGCAPMRESIMETEIRRLRSQVDLLCVGLHWGYEYLHVPQPEQRQLTRQIIQWGADVIVGSHPHVVQGYEYLAGRPVFYSLGNFIFPNYVRADCSRRVWELIQNHSLAGLIRVSDHSGKLTIGTSVIPLVFDFPTVRRLSESEQVMFDMKLHEWLDALREDPSAAPIIATTRAEVRRRDFQWRRNWGKRLFKNCIMRPILAKLKPASGIGAGTFKGESRDPGCRIEK